MIFKKAVIGLASCLAITFIAGAALAADGSETAGVYAAKGEQTCLKCHDDDKVLAIQNTPHAVKGDDRTPAANHGCESCHGASSDHVASRPGKGEKKALPAIRFDGPNASPVAERNAVCLTCHENNARINWQGSQHASNDVACSTCHTVHAKKDPVLVKITQPDKCFTCHSQQRAESFQHSHHPVREGKVSCSDCHNVHGSAGPKLVKEFTVNETCYNCHAEKRGPLLWEHQPVREDCMTCHTPHGSSNDRLLTERMPYLCTGCHSDDPNVVSAPSTRVSSIGWFGGNSAIPGHGSAASGANGNYMQYRSCLNCHPQVHGSNSANGAYFIR